MIKGYYPKEIEEFLQEQIREQAKPQPNLEIEHFLIKQHLKIDRIIEEHRAKYQANLDNYNNKIKELEALRDANAQRRLNSSDEIQNNKPVLNPQKVKTTGIFNAAMDLFFKRSEK